MTRITGRASCKLVLSGDYIALPGNSKLLEHAELVLDTSTFYEGNDKLGVVSSNEILVALAEALGHVTEHRFTTERLISLHNSLHRKNGIGLDIVAATIREA